jgi:hypothetical protein
MSEKSLAANITGREAHHAFIPVYVDSLQKTRRAPAVIA